VREKGVGKKKVEGVLRVTEELGPINNGVDGNNGNEMKPAKRVK